MLGFRGRSELSPRLISIGERNGFVSVAFAFSSLCRFADIGEAEGGLDRECFRSGSGGNESLDSLRGVAAAWYRACASCCWRPKALVFSSSLVLSILLVATRSDGLLDPMPHPKYEGCVLLEEILAGLAEPPHKYTAFIHKYITHIEPA